MEKIILSPAKVKPVPATIRVRRRLADILHQELSLSMARGVLTNLDAIVVQPFSVDMTWHGLNVKLIVHADTDVAQLLVEALMSYPNVRLADGHIIVGAAGQPCVLIFIEWSVSGNDTNGGGR